MKKTLIFAAMIVLLGVVCAYAGSVVNIDVRARVPVGTPEIRVLLYKCDGWNPAHRENPWNGVLVDLMDFEDLIHVYENSEPAGQWYARSFFFAAIYPYSFGHNYQITSTLTPLVSAPGQLPDGCFGMVPGYSADDLWDPQNPNSKQGPVISGETLGGSRGAPHTNTMIWRSRTARDRIIRAFYSIPLPKTGGYPPWSNYNRIELQQPAGEYAGTATITITAI